MGKERGIRPKCPSRAEGLMLPFPQHLCEEFPGHTRLGTNREDLGGEARAAWLAESTCSLSLPSRPLLLPCDAKAELEHTDHSRDPPLHAIS